MMAFTKAGASTHNIKPWNARKWRGAWLMVKRLQMRIAKATLDGKNGKAKSLQWILTHSYYAKVLAVKRVTAVTNWNRKIKCDGNPFQKEYFIYSSNCIKEKDALLKIRLLEGEVQNQQKLTSPGYSTRLALQNA